MELKDLSDTQLSKYRQLHLDGKAKSKRFAGRAQHGTDTKFLAHVVRLLDEVAQLLETGDLDLQRSKEFQKAIRRGDVSEREIRDYFTRQEPYLQKLYETSPLPYGPDRGKIKDLLLRCLEHHYGSLSEMLKVAETPKEKVIREIVRIAVEGGLV